MFENKGKVFDMLDEATSWALSREEQNISNFSSRVKHFPKILSHILSNEITKTDTPEIVMEKIQDTVARFKLKHNLRWNTEQLKSLKQVIARWWRFASDKQRAYFKANIIRN